jgi:phage antirepressor YoqD-like protein
MITVAQAAKKLRISAVRLRQLLLEGRIVGAQRFGRAWAIPNKPVIDPPLKKKHRKKKRKGTKHGRTS